MTEEERLVEKLRKIEALFARPGTAGERLAAEAARAHIKARLAEVERSDAAVELRFSMPDEWSRRLFLALLRRYGIQPYRYVGQKKTSVMARVPQRFLDETLWPQFDELQRTLFDYFDNFTERVIREALGGDTQEPPER